MPPIRVFDDQDADDFANAPLPAPVVRQDQDSLPSPPLAVTVGNVPLRVDVVNLPSIGGSVTVLSADIVDPNNSTTMPLLANDMFTGQAVDMLPFSSVRVALFTDQNSAVNGLRLQWSPDGINWDLTSATSVFAGIPVEAPFGRRGRFFRLTYMNGSVAQQAFRIQVIFSRLTPELQHNLIGLSPSEVDTGLLTQSVLVARNPIDGFINIQSSLASGLHVSQLDGQTGSEAIINSEGEQLSAQLKFLTGGNFFGSIILTNNWTMTNQNGGSTVAGGGIATIATNTLPDGAATLQSFRRALFISGFNNRYQGGVALGDIDGVNNVRRWGAFDQNNGFFFQLHDGVIACVTRKGGADTVSNLNGPNAFALDTRFHVYTIYYRAGGVSFLQDKRLVHTVSFTSSTTLVDDANVSVRFDNLNLNGSDVPHVLLARGNAICRVGAVEPGVNFQNITQAETITLRTEPGTLHKVVVNRKGSFGSLMTLYDGTSASGPIIATIDLNENLGTIQYGLDFNNGLTYVTFGSSLNVTILYS